MSQRLNFSLSFFGRVGSWRTRLLGAGASWRPCIRTRSDLLRYTLATTGSTSALAASTSALCSFRAAAPSEKSSDPRFGIVNEVKERTGEKGLDLACRCEKQRWGREEGGIRPRQWDGRQHLDVDVCYLCDSIASHRNQDWSLRAKTICSVKPIVGITQRWRPPRQGN